MQGEPGDQGMKGDPGMKGADGDPVSKNCLLVENLTLLSS